MLDISYLGYSTLWNGRLPVYDFRAHRRWLDRCSWGQARTSTGLVFLAHHLPITPLQASWGPESYRRGDRYVGASIIRLIRDVRLAWANSGSDAQCLAFEQHSESSGNEICHFRRGDRFFMAVLPWWLKRGNDDAWHHFPTSPPPTGTCILQEFAPWLFTLFEIIWTKQLLYLSSRNDGDGSVTHLGNRWGPNDQFLDVEVKLQARVGMLMIHFGIKPNRTIKVILFSSDTMYPEYNNYIIIESNYFELLIWYD